MKREVMNSATVQCVFANRFPVAGIKEMQITAAPGHCQHLHVVAIGYRS